MSVPTLQDDIASMKEEHSVGPIHLPEPVTESAAEVRKARKRRRFRKVLLHIGAFVLLFHTFVLAKRYFWQHQHGLWSSGGEAETEVFDRDDLDYCPEWPAVHDSDFEPRHWHRYHHHQDLSDELDEHDRHGRHLPYESTVSFNLSATSDLTYLVSKGSAVGDLHITASSEIPSDTVVVNVTAGTWHRHHLKHAKACRLSASDGEDNGVLVWAKPHHGHHGGHHRHRGDRHHHKPPVRFQISVFLPYTEGGSVLSLNNFTTNMTIFPHHIGDLHNKAVFDTISLHAVNAPIYTKSLDARSIYAHTLNSPIHGTYNASKVLELGTMNSPIEGEMHLSNDGSGETSQLHLGTMNSPVKTAIHLAGTSSSQYNITAATIAGNLDVSVLSAPVDSKLTLTATTKLGPAEVVLPPEFEGTYELGTKFASVSVIQEEYDDPKGEERERNVVRDDNGSGRGVEKGYVEWTSEDESGKDRGSVKVTSLFARVTLHI